MPRIKTMLDRMNAENPDKVLDELEAKHGSRASTCSGALQQAAIIAAWHALNSVLAVRDGISDGLIKNIIALLEAAKEGRAYEASEVELRLALEESVKLQSFYAKHLNIWDGGKRIGFKDAAAWVGRLRETKTLPSNDKLRHGADNPDV
jgi:hypothetical protein